jgi:hypothetical protein
MGNLNKDYYNSSNEFNMRINADPEKVEQNGKRIKVDASKQLVSAF